jgi:type I restriction enzyme S subunit
MSFVPLISVAEVQLGKMLSPKAKTGKHYFRYLRNTNVQWGRFEISDVAQMDFSEVEREKFELRFGDLLVCEGGEPGRCAVWRNEIANCYYQKALHRVRPQEGKSDSEFLSFWIRHQAITGAFDDQNAKTTIAHLPQVRLEQLLVPSFNVDQQRQIAVRLKAQLSEVEAARQAALAQLRDADRLRTKITDSIFDECREWWSIADVARVQSGYAFKSEDFKTSGVRLLRNTNILPGKVYWDDAVFLDEHEAIRYPRYKLEAGDILISLDRPLISSGIKIARVSPEDLPALLLQRVGRLLLKPGVVDTDFLYGFLQSSRFMRALSGHEQSLGVPHVSPGQVESVAFPQLSIERQQKLSASLRAQLIEADAIRQAATTQLAEIERLPQRLLAQAFGAQQGASP